MVLDAEKVRFAVEYVTRVANDFRSTNMFFIKNCSLLLREIRVNPQAPANASIHSKSTWQPIASLHSDSVMSFETEEFVHFRGRDPVSAYPLIRLTRNFVVQWSNNSTAIIHNKGLETLREPLKFLQLLLESLVSLVTLLRVFDHRLVSHEDVPKFQIVMQVEIYDLTSSE
jgi:hypothetical protein